MEVLLEKLDFIPVLQTVTVVFSVIVVYFIFLHEKSFKKKNGVYSIADWNFWFKKLYAERIINKTKLEQLSSFNQQKKYDSEDPKYLPCSDSSDSLLFYGCDEHGNYLHLKLKRKRHRISDVWIILQLQNGTIYTLPEHPNSTILNATARKFEIKGLKFECLVPFSRWRISYSGKLRIGIRKTFSNEINDSELEFVRFNFFWIASSDPVHWPHEWSSKLIATSLATEPWKNAEWKENIFKSDSGGYDQYGVLFGQVFIPEKKTNIVDDDLLNFQTITLNLPGIRQRRWGSHKNKNLHRTAVLIGVGRDGSVFKIGAFSSKAGLSHAQFGSMRLANGNVHPIDWTNFHLSNIAEYSDSKPHVTVFDFTANGQTFKVSAHFKNKTAVNLYGGRPLEWSANNVAMEIGLNGERAKGMATFWYPMKGKESFGIEKVVDEPKAQRFFYTNAKVNEKIILPFDTVDARNLLMAGGKGASLGLLSFMLKDTCTFAKDTSTKRRSVHFADGEQDDFEEIQSGIGGCNFIVPNGFVLSVAAFNKHIEQNPNISNSISEIEIVVRENIADLQKYCECTMTLILQSTISPKIEQSIVEAVEDLQKSSTGKSRFAIRSSAIGEDGDESSSAGQNETILGVETKDQVLDAIKKCWASLYSFQSIGYRIQHIQSIRIGMAVVVQVMVPAETAGVMFTKYPLNGDPSKILITCNYGLGETVVSGDVDPDIITINRSYKDELSILSVNVGSKMYRLNMSESNDEKTVEKVELGVNSRNESSLSKDLALKLAKIGTILEKLYGNARDIEWAIVKDRIYLLQSRPITSTNNMTDWELLHEFDSAFMSSDDLVTIGNVSEVMPGVMTPLTQSILLKSLDKITAREIFTHRYGIEHSGLYSRFMKISHHHALIDIMNIMLIYPDREISLAHKIGGLTILGNDFLTPEMNDVALHRFGMTGAYDKLDQFLVMMKLLWSNGNKSSGLVDLMKKIRNTYSEENLRKFTHSSDLLSDLENFSKHIDFASSIHMTTSRYSSISEVLTILTLAEGEINLSSEHYADIALILGSCKNVESAEIPKSLEEIKKVISASGLAQEFLNVKSSEGEAWLLEKCSKGKELFEVFMQNNYHRAVKEFDFATSTWGMDRSQVIEMIQSNLKCSNYNVNTEKEELSNDEIIKRLKTPKKKLSRFMLKFWLPLCKKGVQQREISKSSFVAVIHEIRMGFKHLGVLLFNEGYLPDSGLVFYLTVLELRQLMQSRSYYYINKAMRRRKLKPKWSDIELPEIIWGLPEPLETFKSTKFEDNGFMIRGTPICGGVVKGRACVLKSFEEVHKIEAGDILITHTTDIGWSPYFPMLGGVVTELGGLISHGAVVAREYGLPCIVAAQNATNIFNFGDVILLDAEKGTIVKVSK